MPEARRARTFVRPVLVAAIATMPIAITAPVALAGGAAPAAAAKPVSVAVFGDLPYGAAANDGDQFNHLPAFVDSINADPSISTAIFGGDLHSGKQYCTMDLNQAEFNIFGTLKMPFVYVPGDNEWTDCTKAKELSGSTPDFYSGAKVSFHNGNPVENLGLIRSIFFPVAGWTPGGKGMPVKSQALTAKWGRHEVRRGANAKSKDRLPSSIKAILKNPTDKQYVENVMWETGGTLFVTLNIPGGSNNDYDPWYGNATCGAGSTESITPAQIAEITQRTGAGLRWLNAAFSKAQRDGAEAVAIITQADMWDLDGCDAAAHHLSGYDPIVSEMARLTTAFKKPVLLMNGDSHVAKVDNPLSAADPLNALHPGHDVPNFRRVVWNGSTTIANTMQWIKLTVTPGGKAAAGDTAFGPFSWSTVSVSW